MSQQATERKRVLFVLDASGSMEAKWGQASKMDIAKRTLLSLVDSIQKNNPDIELGLRVFGHQYHKSLNNCVDSKLEIPFGINNLEEFKLKLAKVLAQGNTPIAYSLVASAQDFPDIEAINSIILITDGLENCEGNPCEAAQVLKEKRISINPFIIGLDIEDSLIHHFDCIGSFVNAREEKELAVVLQNTIQKATGKTSLSINLWSTAKQQISNTSFSIIDPISSKTLLTYVHSLTKKGLPDTLYLDPRGKYIIKVHSYPPVSSEIFSLTPSVHNTLNISLDKSYLDTEHKRQYDENEVKYIIRQNDAWIYNYSLADVPLLAGAYQINTSLLPLSNENIKLQSGRVLLKEYEANGKLSIENTKSIFASIYSKETWNLCYDLNLIEGNFSLKLQPGTYSLVYLPKADTNSDHTYRYDFEIKAERTSVIKIL